MTSTNGMFAIVYGPADVPAGKTAEEYEASEAQRREEVVAAEPGCLVYQMVKKDGQYYVLELYSSQDALDTHFKNMGSKRGAIPLSKIKYDTSLLRIFPVVGGYVHATPTATLANLISLPTAEGKGAAFEAAVMPALGRYDTDELDTACYILVKRPDESEYLFIEMWKDQAAGAPAAIVTT
jgi:quinol monooxygenase YgiN